MISYFIKFLSGLAPEIDFFGANLLPTYQKTAVYRYTLI
jgi:hypothetical protein